MGGSEHRNTGKKVTNIASPQEKSTKHTVTVSPATRTFSAMIYSSTLKKNTLIPQQFSTTLFFAHTSILLMPVLNDLVFWFLRRNLARRQRRKRTKKRGEAVPDPSLLLLSSLFLG